MALEFVRDSVEGLPEAIAGHYAKGDDGKFRLAVNLPAGHKIEDSDRLSNTVAATRRERDDAVSRLKSFEGLDPNAAREALKQVDAWKKDGSPEQKLQQQIEAVKREMATAHGAELQKLTARLERYQGIVNKTLVSDNLRELFAKEGANPDLLMPHVAGRLRVIENDQGIPVLRTLTPEGNEALNADGSAKTPAQIVSEFKANPAFAVAFKASGNTGAGATGNAGAAGNAGGGAAPKRISYTDIGAQKKYQKEIREGTVEIVAPEDLAS